MYNPSVTIYNTPRGTYETILSMIPILYALFLISMILIIFILGFHLTFS